MNARDRHGDKQMKRSTVTPLGAMVRGVVAGAAGTVAMDLYWYIRYRTGGGTTGPLRWEFTAAEDWDKVSAPGQVGKRLVEGLTQQQLAPRWAPLTNNLMHWAYGLAWAAAYGAVAGSLRRPRAAYGVLFGSAVWLSGYIILPLGKLYQPLWKYDLTTLAGDLGGHLVYGSTTAVAYAVLV